VSIFSAHFRPLFSSHKVPRYGASPLPKFLLHRVNVNEMIYSVWSPRERLIIYQTSRDLHGNKVEGLDSFVQLGSNYVCFTTLPPSNAQGSVWLSSRA
jgi:hypothetical protein